MTMRTEYDVAIVGGGPTGSVAARAWARRGAKVALLDADPRAAKRFAGEWIHPTGAQVLTDLGFDLSGVTHCRGNGFVVIGDDGQSPIQLPYPTGQSVSAEHEALVVTLRDQAADTDGVEYRPSTRVVELDGNTVVFEDRRRDARGTLRAHRIVGADGRGSVVRRALGIANNSTPLSFMASVELRDAELPFEGSGHVFLGGPGPALLYRIGPDRIRGCLDVPVGISAKRDADFLYRGFAPILPASLRVALRRALDEGPVRWASNRFRPRSHFGTANVWLAGDAAGHVHPLSAIGLTMGFLDAAASADSATLGDYAARRDGYVAELLANVLYGVFMRHDSSAIAVRRSLLKMLRSSEFERRRTMEILTTENHRSLSFAAAFVRTAAVAAAETLTGAARGGTVHGTLSDLGRFTEWLQWPAAAALSFGRARYRARSTWIYPIPALEPLVAAEVAVHAEIAALGETPGGEMLRPGVLRDELQQGIDAGVEVLVRGLGKIAKTVGKVPDAQVAGPAFSMVRAIGSSRMRPGVAARVALARRRLAKDGVPRVLKGNEAWPRASSTDNDPGDDYRTSHVANLILAVLGGAKAEYRIESLDLAVVALLRRQGPTGLFSDEAPAESRAADYACTAVCCRALSVVARHAPDLFEAEIARALDRARRCLEESQRADGSWPAVAGMHDGISTTSWALEALRAAGADGEPLRRGAEWLLSERAVWGGWDREAGTRSDRLTARALRALAGCETELALLVEPALHLARRLSRSKGTDTTWDPTHEIVEALVRVADILERARTIPPSEPSVRATRDPGAESPRELDETDWQYCREALRAVSRTFSEPIRVLPRELEIGLSVGYLLCRIADTIEDHPRVPRAARDRLFSEFLAMFDAGLDGRRFAAAFEGLDGGDAELDLVRNTPRVMRVFRSQPEATVAVSAQWVTEMAEGMRLYSRRPPGRDGLVSLYSISDLERYCYFVAGTVGHLITDLFVSFFPEEVRLHLEPKLREHCESFGLGLQMVNILKDVTDDLSRGWSYLPRSLCRAHGIEPADVTHPAYRARAHAAVEPLFRRAAEHLDAALTYTLAIPADATKLRLFCLLPLWMAVRTLVHARGNDAMFIPGQAVKISRTEVAQLIAECRLLVGNNDKLAARYTSLWENSHPADLDRRSAG